jgi:hypothetical protein
MFFAGVNFIIDFPLTPPVTPVEYSTVGGPAPCICPAPASLRWTRSPTRITRRHILVERFIPFRAGAISDDEFVVMNFGGGFQANFGPSPQSNDWIHGWTWKNG